ncbi:MAG: alpha/beta hydrolase [Oscillibacter sp.]|nr:alpha/beta hydrolase [Oscillibacter sp.]
MHRITAPTLIIGGGDDRVLTGESSAEMAQQIPSIRLILYPHLGHGVYEEAKDFQSVVCSFLLEE